MKKAFLKTPAGTICIGAGENAIESISFVTEAGVNEDDALLVEAQKQLTDYFKGDLKEFDLPLAQTGTDFQNKVWQEVADIPFGNTMTYGQLALKLGDAKLSRAVGTANGKNPFLIVMPCHRVIGEKYKLTGYAGGLDKKKYLLQHEGSLPPEQLSLTI